MQFMKEYANRNGKDAVLYDAKITDVVGTQHTFCIVSEDCDNEGRLRQRTVVKFDRNEFQAVVDEFVRHPPVEFVGSIIAGPAWLVRWLNYWQKRRAKALVRLGEL